MVFLTAYYVAMIFSFETVPDLPETEKASLHTTRLSDVFTLPGNSAGSVNTALNQVLRSSQKCVFNGWSQSKAEH